MDALELQSPNHVGSVFNSPALLKGFEVDGGHIILAVQGRNHNHCKLVFNLEVPSVFSHDNLRCP